MDTTTDADNSEPIAGHVRAAAEAGRPLCIQGGGSKAFYGRTPAGDALPVTRHRGIVSYEPTELVLTARAGTPLAEIEAALAAEGQTIAAEPPHFGGEATLGGAVACGLSGPARPWAGALRDFVLGVRLLNGQGENMRFGGEVMKNVAGYDVARLATASLGTLGVILEVSLKVLPRPEESASRALEVDPAIGFARVEQAYRDGLPIMGAAHDGERLHVRLAGTTSAVAKGVEQIGGDRPAAGDTFWRDLRDQRLAFFTADGPPLWRLSLPPGAEPPALAGERLVDWNGQLVWLRSSTPGDEIFARTAEVGGHATLFAGGDRDGDVFQPLATPLKGLHERIKNAFDPRGVFNPGRMYAGL